jgi:hypothetical protein
VLSAACLVESVVQVGLSASHDATPAGHATEVAGHVPAGDVCARYDNCSVSQTMSAAAAKLRLQVSLQGCVCKRMDLSGPCVTVMHCCHFVAWFEIKMLSRCAS